MVVGPWHIDTCTVYTQGNVQVIPLPQKYSTSPVSIKVNIPKVIQCLPSFLFLTSSKVTNVNCLLMKLTVCGFVHLRLVWFGHWRTREFASFLIPKTRVRVHRRECLRSVPRDHGLRFPITLKNFSTGILDPQYTIIFPTVPNPVPDVTGPSSTEPPEVRTWCRTNSDYVQLHQI